MARFLKLTTRYNTKSAVILINIDHVVAICEVMNTAADRWDKSCITVVNSDGDGNTYFVEEEVSTIIKGLPL